MRRLSTRARWAVPVGTATAVGIVIAVSAVASAAEPSLPARTPAQLLTEVQQAAARPLGPFTATVQESANLGLPALPQVGALGGQSGPASAPDPLAGTTTVNIWYLNPRHVRIAEPAPLGESDLRLNGTKLWLWSSKTQTATQVLLPARLHPPGTHAIPQPRASVQSPGAAVRQLLKAVGPSTSVQAGPNATVAGHDAYQLAIAPKGSGSLVSQILIAIDARTHIPLRVQVFARGSAGPAFQLGFTSLTFGAPAASNFTFTPPPGAKVRTEKVPAAPPAGMLKGLSGLGPAGLGAAGSSPAAVIIGGTGADNMSTYSSTLQIGLSAGTPAPAPLSKAVARQLRASLIAHLPKSMKGAQRREAIRALERSIQAGSQTTWISTTAPAAPPPGFGSGAPKVLGSGWTSVLATPANPGVAAAVQQLLATKTTAMAGGSGLLGGSQAQAKTPAAAGAPVPVGPDLAVLRAVLKATKPVKGGWGSGRLLRTTMLTVLITSKGQILAGAVTPSVLYADAASLSQ